MVLSVEHPDGVALLTLQGDVDAGTVEVLRRAIDELLAKGEHRFVVDLTGVPFMDSSGLATLVQLFKRVRIRAAAVGAVTEPPPEHQEVAARAERLDRSASWVSSGAMDR